MINISLSEVVNESYVYCTDFVINLANLTDTSYYEVNFFLFCVLYPFLLLLLPSIALYLKLKLHRIHNTNKVQS
jgi:hypothetical protein